MQPGSRSAVIAAATALLLCVAAVVAVAGIAAGPAVGSDGDAPAAADVSGTTDAPAAASVSAATGAPDAASPLADDNREAIEGDVPGEAAGNGVGPLTRCFTGEGYPISIGDEGATIDALVHLSVLTDPTVGNEFGLEAAGAIGGDPIVTLAAGVRLTTREAFANGLNPFAAFDVLYTYELRLPMFDGAVGDTEYRDEGSPITSAAGVVPC